MSPGKEAFAAGVAMGLSQSAAYRRAFPISRKWQTASVWTKASTLAADAEVSARVAELSAQAAATNEVTVERITRELARLSFFDVRRTVGPDGRPLGLHELDEDTARAIVGIEVVNIGNSDVGIGEVLKFKMGDKKGSLELLGRKVGMFEKDNEQARHLTRVVIVPGKVAPGEADDGPGG